MRLLGRLALFLVLLPLAVVTMVFVTRDPERRDLDAAARAEAPGKFVSLADGQVHHEVAGPDSGRPVVLAAGFSVPAYIRDSLFQGLADGGFRVVRHDYHGRGWSDRTDAAYDRELLERQLAVLLDSPGIREPGALAGHSFGGAVVANFANGIPTASRRSSP